MKFFALAGLAAVVEAKDFIGCDGSSWGHEQEMRDESNCIFDKLKPVDGELHKA